MSDNKTIKRANLSHKSIFAGIVMTILLVDSVITILSIFKNGIRKKEILSSKTTYGFDFDIVIKP